MTAPEKRRLVEHARRLRELHVPGHPLVLPNAWDATSAAAVIEAGYPAVATSSGAVAEVLGYADHEQTPPEEMFAAIGRICRVTDVPVTADLEAGYRLPADELVARLLAAGAVGCNIEDTEHPSGHRVAPDTQATRLAAIRDAAAAQGVDVVLNARIDSWLRPDQEDDRFADALTRARAYRAAGADCLYPIGLADPDTIARFVRETAAPVNVLRHLDGPSHARLAEFGVARISYGTALFRHLSGVLRRTLTELPQEL